MASLAQTGIPQHAWHRLQQVFQTHPAVEKAVVFGSRAKGNHRPGSDIDLCLTAPDLSLHQLWAIDAQIDDLLLPWKVDLVLHHTIDTPELLEHIQRVGLLIFERATPTQPPAPQNGG